MRLSFMTFACPDYELHEVLAAAAKFGYAGVEPRVTAGHEHGIEPVAPAQARASARKAFQDAGIEIACIATSCRFASLERSEREKNRSQLMRHLELASDLGARRIRVFGGKRAEGLDLDQAIQIVAEDLFSCADFAAQHGVKICLETHDDFSLGSSVGKVLQKADHPAVQATWDVMHPYRAGESVADTVRHLSGKIAHVHFHDNEKGKALLPGDGDLPMAQQIAALRSERFTGFLSAELWPEIGPPDFILQEYHQRMVNLLAA